MSARRTQEPEPGEWRAIVDIGAVSTALLLTDGNERIRRSVDTHLGAGTVAPSGDTVAAPIAAASLDRLRAVLVDYRALADDKHASIRAIGSSPARRASNRAEFQAVIADTLGVALDAVGGADEARLSFAGACSGLPGDGAGLHPPDQTVVTIDLGGGSTDFAAGRSAASVDAWSVPIGGVLVAKTYFESDPPDPAELSAALSVIELHLDDLRREAPALATAVADPDAIVIGLGGVVTIAAVEVGLLDVDPLNGDGDGPLHDFVLERAAVEDVFRTLATESRNDRAHNPGLAPSRVDDIVGGCAVLVETMRQFGIDEVTVSQRGLADGALAAGARVLTDASGDLAENR
ncbi:MAG: hypothetical protein ACR2QO_27660 [Acidimicrobiales bacterium]